MEGSCVVAYENGMTLVCVVVGETWEHVAGKREKKNVCEKK